MQKTYNRINWENYPSDRTPLNETNLNKLDVGVNELDNRIITLDNTKFDKTEASQLIKNFELDKATGIITVTYFSGATATIDTMLEKLAVNFDFDKTSQKLVIVLDDGTVKEIDLTALITEYEFKSTDTVAFSVDADGNVSAIVKDGSIQERHLRPNYLADIRVESAKAEASAVASDASAIASEISAVRAESWAVGGTNTRTDEDTDNAKFYYEASKQIFNDFENVGAVVGVKGDTETDYRAGFVNITAENVGALPSKVVISQVNFDDLKTTGIYHIKSAVETNRPTDSQGTLVVEFDVGTPFQIWIPDNQYVMYKRIYLNNSWQSWSKMEAGNADTAKNVTAEAGSRDANRHVWFSDGSAETKRNYDDDFMYNPATNTLLVKNLDGTAKKATQDGNGNNIPDTYATKNYVLDNFDRLGLNALDIDSEHGNWSVGLSDGATPDGAWANIIQFDSDHFRTQISIGCDSGGAITNMYYRNAYSNNAFSEWNKINGKADSAKNIIDYNDSDTNIQIGWRGSGVSVDDFKHFAAYIQNSDGGARIKDLSLANAKSILGLNLLAAKSDILNTATAIEASTSDDNIVGAKGLKDYGKNYVYNNSGSFQIERYEYVNIPMDKYNHHALIYITTINSSGSLLDTILASFNKLNGVWVEGEEVFGANNLDNGSVYFNCEANRIRFSVGYSSGATVNYSVIGGF